MKMKIFTIFLCAMFAAVSMAQDRPTYEVQKASVAPELDGVVDDVWDEADPANIDKNFQDELPTLGTSGETYWKALWVENEGVYILLIVNDDEFLPHYYMDPPGNSWEYDKPEIYFDCNYDLQDGGGAGGGPANGHHQFAPPFADGLNDGTVLDAGVDGEADPNDAGVLYAFMVNDPDYIAEYFVPLERLTDRDGIVNDLSGELGFDVTIIDRDTGDDARKRAVWANTGVGGAADESWNSMDDCGIITFAGVGEKVYVESITLTGGEITENNGTLQVQAEVLPEDASNKALTWTLENGTGRGTINSEGVVTGVVDGDVTVTAAAKDGSYVEATTTVTISNQIISMKELNVIRNGNFDRVNPDGTAAEWGGWGGDLGAPLPQVIDGVAVCTPARNFDNDANWQYQFNQTDLTALPDIEYEFSFVAWADAPRTFSVDFEDIPDNDYNRYGATTDPRSADGRSEWTFDVTMEPVKYVFDVTFDQIMPNTVQKVQYMLGLSDTVCYIDSVMLINLDDLDLLTDYNPVTEITVSGEEDATTVAEGGTLQMSATVLPEDADYKDVKWSVEPGTGWASIDEAGLLTGDTVGTVTVIASAVDDSEVTGSLEVEVSFPEGITQHSMKTLKVYPNPATSELNVVVAAENTTVTIYNSVGMKIEEAVISGTVHKFDVSNYAAGLYFVKTDDSVVKFIK